MTTNPTEAEKALWRRWQALAPAPGLEEPDFMDLAAAAEGRASAEASDAVDEWLVARPERLGDLVAARMAADTAAESAPDATADRMMARAMALVATPADAVVPFRRAVPQAAGWRGAVAWSGIAASLAAACLVGVVLGNSAWSNLLGNQQTAEYQELLDPPTGIFTGISEDEGT